MYQIAAKTIGYHGTYPENLDSILEHNFFETTNHSIWLGDGVYFFVDGVGDLPPLEYAKSFAIDQCYNSELRKHEKTEVSVLQASIKVNNDKLLDLTIIDGHKLFNKFRLGIIQQIESSGKTLKGQYKDSDVFKIMEEKIGIEFVKADVYIKFAVQRIGRFESIIPNVTIFKVRNAKKNIQKPSIKEVYRGVIK
jgi:hypothetical protein